MISLKNICGYLLGDMYTVYAIRSLVRPIIYVGLTGNLSQRIIQHNASLSFWTKRYRPWRLIFTESFPDRPSARAREKRLKTRNGKKFLKKFSNQ